MSTLNTELHSLLNWDIYKDEKKFQNYIYTYNINPKDTISLIAAHKNLKEASKDRFSPIKNRDIIDKALEIKLKHEYAHMSKNILMNSY